MNPTPINIAVSGANGRMGRMLIEALLNARDLRLSGALVLKLHESQDAAAFLGKISGVQLQEDLEKGLANASCLIDFTRPNGTMLYLEYCVNHSIGLVIGTTGFDAQQKLAILKAAEKIPIVLAPNMSIGVNVTMRLLKLAAENFTSGYDVEIIEAHHRHKVDAPSGTALAMGEIIAHAQGRRFDEVAVFERYGHTGERQSTDIGFSVIRGGDIVGDHTVLFAGVGERIEISHKSSSRQSYAEGALCAARFLTNNVQGIYNMQDVLGFKD